MGFIFIYTFMNVCKNPWCKGHYQKTETHDKDVCPKCFSFDNELSGGISWDEKKYEGSRFDGLPHQISIKINKWE